MELKDAVAVVTGANRGLGRHLAAQLVERGAKVYAAARRPETVNLPGVTPLLLDVTDEESIRAAARTASDATLLVNNAGISTATPLIAGGLDAVRLEQVEAAVASLRDAPHPEGFAADELPRRVVEIVYVDVDPVLWGAAELSVRAQLDYLAQG